MLFQINNEENLKREGLYRADWLFLTSKFPIRAQNFINVGSGDSLVSMDKKYCDSRQTLWKRNALASAQICVKRGGCQKLENFRVYSKGNDKERN